MVAATSAAAVLLASSVSALDAAGSSAYTADAALLVLICAGLFVLAGVLRLGFLCQFLSRPVMEGFVFGIAIFVAVKQLPKLFGIEKGGGDTIAQFAHVLANLGSSNGRTVVVGVSALGLLFALDRLLPRLPGGLIVLALGIIVSSALHLSDHGVAIVGHVPRGLPSVSLSSVDSTHIPDLVAAAGGMVLVIFSESLGATPANFTATKYGYTHRPQPGADRARRRQRQVPPVLGGSSPSAGASRSPR